jgi:hypothetical protein
MDRELPLAESGCSNMKGKAYKRHPQRQYDDLWSWVVIAVIVAAVTLALYGPLLWQVMHGS